MELPTVMLILTYLMQLENTLQNQKGLFQYFMLYSNTLIDSNSGHFACMYDTVISKMDVVVLML